MDKKSKIVYKILFGVCMAIFIWGVFFSQDDGLRDAVDTSVDDKVVDTIVYGGVVSINQIFEDYNSNKIRAEGKYRGKRYDITNACVSSIVSERSVAVMGCNDQTLGLKSLNASGFGREEILSLERDDYIKLSCVVGLTLITYPYLDDCFLSN